MKDILHPLCLIIAGSGFMFLLRDLRKDRRDPALVALTFTYFFSALSYAISLTPVWLRIDGTLGVTNIAVPLAHGCVILVLALQAVVLANWSMAPADVRRRTRFLLASAVTVIGGLAVLFALLTPTTQRPVDFSLYYAHDPFFQSYLTLYIGTYTMAEVYLARMCWKHARDAANPWIARGLRLISIGAVITLGYSAVRISSILGAAFGFSVKELEPYAWICGDIGATLTQIGYFLPTLTSGTKSARVWGTEHLQHWRLRRLWQALYEAEPSIALMPPASQGAAFLRLRSVRFLLYRRTVEIRDGQIELRPYLDPAARKEVERRRRAEGLQGPALAAAITADQIRHALARKHHGPVSEPAAYADAALSTLTTDQELHHLVRVAAYFTPPPAGPEAEDRSATGART
ncbi:MAB_1171c family putative transporter [Streptomyces avermitilis]|uniref:MAB_1171c family putative transporter n=1 Tax=Streptomyces avermitilis TaxID=33903 RepID=UPI003718342B